MRLNRLDRTVADERRRKYKRLTKLRKARDMASKHSKHKLLLSDVFNLVRFDKADEYMFTGDLAKYILDRQLLVAGIRPPSPPIRKRS